MSIATHLAFGRSTHPKLGHTQWLQAFLVCSLKKSWRTTFARSRWWHGRRKEFCQRTRLALSIQKRELTEQPLLQGIAPLVAFRLQSCHLLLLLSQCSLVVEDTLLPSLLQPSVFCLMVLPFFNKPSPIILRLGTTVLTFDIAFRLALLHKSSVGSQFLVHLPTQRTWLHGALEQRYTTVDVADGCFLLLEITTGSHQVEDRRHKVFVLCLAIERTGKGCKEPQSDERLHYEVSKHLAPLHLFVQLCVPTDVASHLVGSSNTKRMRFVAERISELLRGVCLFHTGRQGVQRYSHRTPSGP